MISVRKKIRWWWGSVQGLRAHLAIHREILRHVKATPVERRTAELMSQLRQQEGMVGHCLLHVLMVYELGSGMMCDEDG